MKAVYYQEHGEPTVLQSGELPDPEAKADEVLVQVAAAGVNPIDRRLRAGELQEYIKREFPVVPGWDFSGRIVGLGSNVTDWKIGDEVVGLACVPCIHHGTYAELIPVSASAISHKPASMSFSEAAALPLVSLTAWQALSEFAELSAGQSVLVQAGAGGVGSVAIPMAKYLGAKVYTTCSSGNMDYVRALGADIIIDYTSVDYVKEIAQLEPTGLDMVLESILSDECIESAIYLTKSGGTVAYLNNEPPEMTEIAEKNIKTAFIHHRPDGYSLGEIMKLYESGVFKIPNIHEMLLSDAAEAHRISEKGRTRGKVVLRVQEI
ncbi:MAG: zinc-binding dehydrogenase [Pseudomonadales bacterium]|nr:zinc-binding dehydrogenase [Pseudomonadales bacterium]